MTALILGWPLAPEAQEPAVAILQAGVQVTDTGEIWVLPSLGNRDLPAGVLARFDLPDVYLDKRQIQQAILNLLINATQAMPDGGTVEVGVSANDKIVTVNFDDNGSGISEEVLEKIWDPFYTTKEKGSGLGLGIIKNIIESHGGSIQVRNRAEGGARVSVELPA